MQPDITHHPTPQKYKLERVKQSMIRYSKTVHENWESGFLPGITYPPPLHGSSKPLENTMLLAEFLRTALIFCKYQIHVSNCIISPHKR
jgi:hypothetical protein